MRISAKVRAVFRGLGFGYIFSNFGVRVSGKPTYWMCVISLETVVVMIYQYCFVLREFKLVCGTHLSCYAHTYNSAISNHNK